MQVDAKESQMISLDRLNEKSSHYMEGGLAFHCDQVCRYAEGSREYEEWHKGYAAEDEKEMSGQIFFVVFILVAVFVFMLIVLFLNSHYGIGKPF